MHVLMLSHSDTGGGAAIAARRLQQGLRIHGVDVRMLVRRRSRSDETVLETSRLASRFLDKTRFAIDKLPLLAYPDRDSTPFSPQWLPDGLERRIARLRPDVVHLHWIGHGYMHPETLSRLKRPIVWTLHDVWPFTGGCHVNLGCTRYEERCGACPRLGSTRDQDLSRAGWQRKHDAWKDVHLTVVAPSTWMADSARRSSLFRDKRVEVIHNGLDTQTFRPVDKMRARSILELPRDKSLVLFATASGRRVPHKGLDLLESALDVLHADSLWQERIGLVLAGPSKTAGTVRSGFSTHPVGSIQDEEKMAALYAAVDVTVVLSRQESLSQVAVESMACGTPVVAFDATGLPDVVDHRENGYLARPFDPEDLAHGIAWVIEDADRYRILCEAARSKAVLAFDLGQQAGRYNALFREMPAMQGTYSA